MGAMVQQNLPPMPLQRLDDGRESRVQKMDDVPLQMAKATMGRALRQTITRTSSGLKDFGDPSHVNRVCDGEIPSVLARAWMREDTRREFVLALAEASGLAEIETTVRIRRRA